MAATQSSCECSRIGRGAQTFRIRGFANKFEMVADLGPATELFLESRIVCSCKACNRCFALIRVLEKDVEEILVAVFWQDWSFWNWAEIASEGVSCRWRGSEVDERYVW